MGKEYNVKEIDKVFINYSENEGKWGREGFKLYGADDIELTFKNNDYDFEVIETDNSQWNLILNENNIENCKLQNYYQKLVSDYESNFRYLKLEYTYGTHNIPWGIHINEFALYAPVEEVTTEEVPTEMPTEPSTLRPVTDAGFVDADSTVTNVSYQYKYEQAGYAAGTISLTTVSDEKYSLYWGTGNDEVGYKALTRNNVPYTELGSVTSSSNQGNFNVISDYTAIPLGATNLLVLNEENDIQFVYEIPSDKVFDGNDYTYTFASVGDQHYNRFNASGKDDAIYAFDNALKFIDSQGVKFVAGTGDISSISEKSAYTKFREAANDYPDLTVLTCIGNHDCVDNGKEYFKQYINQSVYKHKNEDAMMLASRGILNIADNEMDFVYSPDGTDDVFVFLNQNQDETNNYTQSYNILYDEQLDWLDAQLAKYTDRNVYLYFHTYLSTDSLDVKTCVGNLINNGGVYYNLTYDTADADGIRLRSIINKYDNLTMFNGHSHWMYSMQIFNPNLNIGTTSIVPFSKGATIVHVSSVTEPRYVGINDTARTGMNNKASEGMFTDVYSDYNVYTGVDFWNGQYEAYATYIVPKGEMTPPKEPETTSEDVPTKEAPSEDESTKETPSEDESTKEAPSEDIKPEEPVGLIVSSNSFNEISITFSNPQGEIGNTQLYNIYIDDTLVYEGIEAGTYICTNQNAGVCTVKVKAVINGIESTGVTDQVDVTAFSVESAQIQINTDKGCTYTGKEIKPAVAVLTDSLTLIKDTDYKVTYENNKNAGTATIIINGIGRYTGSVVKHFNISKKPISDVTIKTSFNSKNQLVINIDNGGNAMIRDKDYSYDIVTDEKGNITITFKGLGDNYAGTTVKHISAGDNPNKPEVTTTPSPTIKVKTPIIKKAKNYKPKRVKLTWKRISNVSGYKIRYSTNKKFKKSKIKKINKNIGKYVIKRLKRKKRYYIQIRAYKIYNGKTYEGNWSKSKKVKIKK